MAILSNDIMGLLFLYSACMHMPVTGQNSYIIIILYSGTSNTQLRLIITMIKWCFDSCPVLPLHSKIHYTIIIRAMHNIIIIWIHVDSLAVACSNLSASL